MARVTNDGEPTYGSENSDPASEKTEDAEIRPTHHFSAAPAGPLPAAENGSPLVRVRPSEDGSHVLEEPLPQPAAFSAAA